MRSCIPLQVKMSKSMMLQILQATRVRLTHDRALEVDDAGNEVLVGLTLREFIFFVASVQLPPHLLCWRLLYKPTTTVSPCGRTGTSFTLRFSTHISIAYRIRVRTSNSRPVLCMVPGTSLYVQHVVGCAAESSTAVLGSPATDDLSIGTTDVPVALNRAAQCRPPALR